MDEHDDQYLWYVNMRERIFEPKLCQFDAIESAELAETLGDMAPEVWLIADRGENERCAIDKMRRFNCRLYRTVEEAIVEVDSQIHALKKELDEYRTICHGEFQKHKKPPFYD